MTAAALVESDMQEHVRVYSKLAAFWAALAVGVLTAAALVLWLASRAAFWLGFAAGAFTGVLWR